MTLQVQADLNASGELLETVINLVRRHAPGAAIAFNGAPDTTWEAASRWIG